MAVDRILAAMARTEMDNVQVTAIVALLRHGRAEDAAFVLPWRRDEPVYAGLQQRLEAALLSIRSNVPRPPVPCS